MRKYFIKGLEVFHGFLVLSLIYCSIMQQISSKEAAVLAKSLILLPAVGILAFSVEKVKHFWQYFLIAGVTVAVSAAAAGEGYFGIWMGVCVFVAAFSYFAARAGDRDCWLNTPAYPMLVLYLVIYLLGNYFDRIFLMRQAAFGAGLYYLVCNIYINWTQMDDFVRTHSSLERLPVRRLGKINSRMMWLQSGVIAAAMFAAPFLGIDGAIRYAGKCLLRLIALLLSFLPSGGEEEIMQEAAEQVPQMLPESGEAPSALLMLLYKILDFIGWMIFICLVLAVVWIALKKIYGLYRQFNDHTEENGDRIERLIAPPSEEKKSRLEKQRRENLFWDRSPNGRIRKFYKKRVWKDLKEAPEPFWTPSQLEEEVVMSGEEKEKFHFYYEKARYGKEKCTREEMQEMMKLH